MEQGFEKRTEFNKEVVSNNQPIVYPSFSFPVVMRVYLLQNNVIIPKKQNEEGNSNNLSAFYNPFILRAYNFSRLEVIFYKQMLAVYFHSIRCINPCTCQFEVCKRYISLIQHQKTCRDFNCKGQFCIAIKFCINHICFCHTVGCPFCSNFRKAFIEIIRIEAKKNPKFSQVNLENMNPNQLLTTVKFLIEEFCKDTTTLQAESFGAVKGYSEAEREKLLADIFQQVIFSKRKFRKFFDDCSPLKNQDLLIDEIYELETFCYVNVGQRTLYQQVLQNIKQLLLFMMQCLLDICPKVIDTMLDDDMKFFIHPTDENTLTLINYKENREFEYGLTNAFNFWDSTTLIKKNTLMNSREVSEKFLVLVQNLYNHPDGYPFQVPVDPIIYNIPDYFDIIYYPMDLSTILERLNVDYYVEPWEVVHDIWLMFTNAWTYNRRTTKIFKITTRLCDFFIKTANPVMKSLGYCCSQRRVYTPQMLYCLGKDYCVIKRDVPYFHYREIYLFCEECFNKPQTDVDKSNQDYYIDIPCDEITSNHLKPPEEVPRGIVYFKNSNNIKMKRIPKKLFKKEYNDKIFMETILECKGCSKKLHQICQLFNYEIKGSDFFCDICLAGKKAKYQENLYRAEYMKQTMITEYLETKVNKMLNEKMSGIDPVIIRMIYNGKKEFDVKEPILERYNNTYEKKIGFVSKTFLAFQKTDKSDLCFFSLHVQEYGNDCGSLNKGRVYISYLDSVHFFQPKHLKTDVYFEILTAYFECCARRNFSYVHIWVCPPSEGDDYIFHCHPPDQRIPRHKRLTDWYQKLLDINLKLKIFKYVKTLHQYIVKDKNNDINQIPFFEGDYWHTAFEDVINDVKVEGDEEFGKSLMGRQRSRVMCRMDDYLKESEEDVIDISNEQEDFNEVKKSSKKVSGSKLSKKNTKRKIPSNHESFIKVSKLDNSNQKKKFADSHIFEVENRLMNLLIRFKEVFFVCRLNTINNNAPNLLPNVLDDFDPPIVSELTDGRSGILQLCREKKWEFSTISRAKFATIGLVMNLHLTLTENLIVFICNICKCQIFEKHHCTMCVDFDLCSRCLVDHGHDHELELIQDHVLIGISQKPKKLDKNLYFNPELIPKPVLEKYNENTILVEYLLHATNCLAADLKEIKFSCLDPVNCLKLKKAISHCKFIHSNFNPTCQLCNSIFNLSSYHSKDCENYPCQVVFCDKIKQRKNTPPENFITPSSNSVERVTPQLSNPSIFSSNAMPILSSSSLNETPNKPYKTIPGLGVMVDPDKNPNVNPLEIRRINVHKLKEIIHTKSMEHLLKFASIFVIIYPEYMNDISIEERNTLQPYIEKNTLPYRNGEQLPQNLLRESYLLFLNKGRVSAAFDNFKQKLDIIDRQNILLMQYKEKCRILENHAPQLTNNNFDGEKMINFIQASKVSSWNKLDNVILQSLGSLQKFLNSAILEQNESTEDCKQTKDNMLLFGESIKELFEKTDISDIIKNKEMIIKEHNEISNILYDTHSQSKENLHDISLEDTSKLFEKFKFDPDDSLKDLNIIESLSGMDKSQLDLLKSLKTKLESLSVINVNTLAVDSEINYLSEMTKQKFGVNIEIETMITSLKLLKKYMTDQAYMTIVNSIGKLLV